MCVLALIWPIQQPASPPLCSLYLRPGSSTIKSFVTLAAVALAAALSSPSLSSSFFPGSTSPSGGISASAISSPMYADQSARSSPAGRSAPSYFSLPVLAEARCDLLSSSSRARPRVLRHRLQPSHSAPAHPHVSGFQAQLFPVRRTAGGIGFRASPFGNMPFRCAPTSSLDPPRVRIRRRAGASRSPAGSQHSP